MKKLNDRRSIRLKGYDYSSPGVYYLTLCTEHRYHLFGKIENGKMILSDEGKNVQKCWYEIPNHYPNVELDAFVIMPNHIHGIIIIKYSDNIVEANNNSPFIEGANDHSPQRFPDSPQRFPDSPQRFPDSPQRFPDSPQRPRGTSKTVGAIVRGFKIGVTKLLREKYKEDIWQRNYYEHIVRTEADLNRIRKYINNNPMNWKGDRFHVFRRGE